MNRKQKTMVVRIAITTAILVAVHAFHVAVWLRIALYLTAYLVIGYDILYKAGCLQRRPKRWRQP